MTDEELKRAAEDEKPVPNDLEEAAESFAFKSLDEVILYGCTLSGRRACFLAGAKWQKQHDAELIEIAYNDGITIGMTKQKDQMMEEAVEVEVTETCGIPSLWLKMKDCNEGDKVRIIIIKDDGKSD